MKKTDFINGDIAEFRNGELGILVRDTFLTFNSGGMSFDLLDDDLKRKNGFGEDDIVKVYRPNSFRYNAGLRFWLEDKYITDSEHSELIWERPACVEVPTSAHFTAKVYKDKVEFGNSTYPISLLKECIEASEKLQ